MPSFVVVKHLSTPSVIAAHIETIMEVRIFLTTVK
jgi:hypothetical protein